jgi:hypothetical protein
MLDVLSGTFRVVLAILVGASAVMVFVNVFRGFRARFMADLDIEHREYWWKSFWHALGHVLVYWLAAFCGMWLLRTLW